MSGAIDRRGPAGPAGRFRYTIACRQLEAVAAAPPMLSTPPFEIRIEPPASTVTRAGGAAGVVVAEPGSVAGAVGIRMTCGFPCTLAA